MKVQVILPSLGVVGLDALAPEALKTVRSQVDDLLSVSELERRDFVAEAMECEIGYGLTFGEVAQKLRRLVGIQQDIIRLHVMRLNKPKAVSQFEKY